MGIRKKIAVSLVGLVIVCALALGYTFRSGTSEAYQHDADIIRLHDLVEIGALIEEFKDLTGKYPLEGVTNLDNYVAIATPEQQQYNNQKIPYSHKKTTIKEFINELESGLGRSIRMPTDPQRVPVNKPNWYVYMIRGEAYFLAIHTHNAFPFSRRIGDYYYKVEVSNRAIPDTKIWKYEELIVDKEFQSAIAASMHKSDYFKAMREKTNS